LLLAHLEEGSRFVGNRKRAGLCGLVRFDNAGRHAPLAWSSDRRAPGARRKSGSPAWHRAKVPADRAFVRLLEGRGLPAGAL